jgi:preprotein translocase subunit SecG
VCFLFFLLQFLFFLLILLLGSWTNYSRKTERKDARLLQWTIMMERRWNAI